MIWKTWIPFHHPWGYPVKFDSKLFIINWQWQQNH
jgi:hypothetical protein